MDNPEYCICVNPQASGQLKRGKTYKVLNWKLPSQNGNFHTTVEDENGKPITYFSSAFSPPPEQTP